MMDGGSTSAWPVVPLGSVIVDARSGFACGDEDDYGVIQFRMHNVTREGTIDWSKVRRVPTGRRNLESLYVLPGDLLFNSTSSPELVGKCAVFPGGVEPVTFSNHFHRLRPDVARTDGRYLSRWITLQWSRGVFRGMCRQWVNQATVTKEQLLALPIPLPPVAEQRRIAEILQLAETIRTKRRQALGRLATLSQALFLSTFGDPVLNRKSWPTAKLVALGTLDRGVSKNRPRNAPELLGGPYPLVQTGDVANCDGYVREYGSTYSEEGLRQSKMWPAGTLCITIAANIGKTGVLTFDACFPDSVVGFRGNEPSHVDYVRIWFSFLQKGLEESASQVAQKNINLAVLRDLDIPVPPLSLRRRFSQQLAAIERLKTAQRASLSKLDSLFSSLQDRAFRGEL